MIDGYKQIWFSKSVTLCINFMSSIEIWDVFFVESNIFLIGN